MLYLPRLFFKRVNKSNFHLLYSRDFDPSLTNLSLYDVLDILQKLIAYKTGKFFLDRLKFINVFF